MGLLKRQWVAEELGKDSLDVQRRIKQTLDPRGILNPRPGQGAVKPTAPDQAAETGA
ncbi:hypothetical protein KDL01_19940 [Actinospica durhamensis]|uniref:FAD-binding oxidoreductase/transferase type 4 C-terminal domain-containing protein n=1 Tax=Actinospica durhamensis TaxID=1508375 RepID=A0A941IT34_9ACTN|nr:hypothetical protein [Actinospica durhamensis]